MTGLILGIYNSDGVIVARYVYDAFGNHKVYDGYYNANTNDSFIRTIKPFRYKRYFYDEDVNLYYLKSRFYNPLCGRFLTDDDEAYIDESSFIGFNLFTYCGNDPVNKYNANGNFWDTVFDATFIAWEIHDLVNGGYKDWKNWVTL